MTLPLALAGLRKQPEPDYFARQLAELHKLNSNRRRTAEEVGFPNRVRTVSAWLLTYSDGQRHVSLCGPEMTADDVRNMGCHHRPYCDFHVTQIGAAGFQVYQAEPSIYYWAGDGRRLGRHGLMLNFSEHQDW